MNENVFRSLVIEDSTSDQLVISKQLHPLNGVNVTVETAEQALRLFESGDRFSLLLVDWNLPGMNGLQLVRQIRAHKNGADVKIISNRSGSGVKIRGASRPLRGGFADANPG